MIESFILGKNMTMEVSDQVARVASHFKSELYFVSPNKKINCKSLLGIVSLGAKVGDEIAILSTGVDETEAFAALQELLI